MSKLKVQVPRAFAPLLKPARYKGAYGGRGSGKSHFFAEQIVIRCHARTTRVVCIREVQNSIKESVHQLIKDKIEKFGLQDSFTILENEVRHKTNGSLIIFKGMQSYSAANIKSLEGYDIAWWEEAQTASAKSLRLLRPTLRKEGSELWFGWNPDDEDDPVDQFFRGPEERQGTVCVRVNWEDNPWFPDVLRTDMEDDYAADAEMAEHVWGGEYLKVTEGAYYAHNMAEVERAGRIGSFPHDPALPVMTSWDLGVDDYTAVWFWQVNGLDVRCIDYHEFSGIGAEQIVSECMPEMLPDDRAEERAETLKSLGRDVPFKYSKHYLPHDVKVREWGGGAKTRQQVLMGLGLRGILVGKAQGPAERIQATRALLPIVSFDKDKCHLGVKRMRRYRRRENSSTGQFGEPLKDGNDHCADAFGEFAVNCGIRPRPVPKAKKPKPKDYKPIRQEEAAGWR